MRLQQELKDKALPAPDDAGQYAWMGGYGSF